MLTIPAPQDQDQRAKDQDRTEKPDCLNASKSRIRTVIEQ